MSTPPPATACPVFSVPLPPRLAIMTLVARWFENREGAAHGVVPAAVVGTIEALVAPYRMPRLR